MAPKQSSVPNASGQGARRRHYGPGQQQLRADRRRARQARVRAEMAAEQAAQQSANEPAQEPVTAPVQGSGEIATAGSQAATRLAAIAAAPNPFDAVVAATIEQRGPAGQPTLADLLGSPGLEERQGAVQRPTSGGSTATSPVLPQQVVPDRPGFEVRFVEGVPYWFPAPETRLS
ncbi:hypothetical protein MYU51_013555 [Penicillium brevicompactum]